MEPVVGNSEVRRLEERIRELERLLGRKTMEVEILKEALAKAQAKKTELAARVAAEGRFPMKTIANVLGVARSHLHERVHRPTAARGSYCKAADEELLPLIRRLVDERPTYGYRRVTALVNRVLAAEGKAAANHKRVFRIMKRHGLLLQPHTGRRKGRLHDGKVVVMRSNLRWCSDVFEITCWNGEIVRIVFVIDAHDREVLAWHAVAGAGVSGSMVRDLMLEAVELRFATIQAPHAVEWLSDNGSPFTAKETLDFAAALGLVPCFTPVHSPESNGIAEAFVETFKRDYARIHPFSAADDHAFDALVRFHILPIPATPSTREGNHIRADVILAKQLERLIRWRLAFVSERIYAPLPRCHRLCLLVRFRSPSALAARSDTSFGSGH